MARSNLIKEMIYKDYSPLNFDFWKLQAPPLFSLVSIQDVQYIHNIITSPKYSSKLDYKNQAIDYTMRCRGFRKLHAGTNRLVYKHEEIPSIVMKVPYREIALTDGPREYRNQYELFPFVSRTFEYTQCGTMSLHERVQPITSIPEYMSLKDSIFELLVNRVLGKYVLEDIGTKYFKNIGIRDGFGPVLIDYPIMYKLDGKKLYCNKVHIDGSICDGIIDYDEGFNKLICKKCGQRYYASELAKDEEENKIVKGFYAKGDIKMEICIMKGKNVVSKSEKMTSTIESNVLDNNIEVEVEGDTKPTTTVDKVVVEEEKKEEVNYIKLPKLDIPPTYLNIEGYGVYKLQTPLEVPEDIGMNPPIEDVEIPTKDDYDKDGKFKLEKDEEKSVSKPIDARTEYEDTNTCNNYTDGISITDTASISRVNYAEASAISLY